ncbi:MAG: hypothetical protein ACRETL_09165 [Gammaproteobacteria bacterium]
MSTKTPYAELPRSIRLASDAVSGTIVCAIRATSLVVFLLMSLAEPVLAVVLSGMALACFAVAILFGFILHAPFPHRWFVLGASVVFLASYLLFRFVMLCVERLMR